jgi:hypothetical protein
MLNFFALLWLLFQGIQIFCGLLGLARMGLLLAYSGITRPEFQLSMSTAIASLDIKTIFHSFVKGIVSRKFAIVTAVYSSKNPWCNWRKSANMNY